MVGFKRDFHASLVLHADSSISTDHCQTERNNPFYVRTTALMFASDRLGMMVRSK